MRFSIALALVAFTTTSAEVAGQFRLEPEPEPERSGWSQPTLFLGDGRHAPIPLEAGTEDSRPVARDESALPGIMGAMLAASMGSVAGGFAGVYLGVAATAGRGDYYAGALTGAFLGSLGGATLGAGWVTKRGGRAFLGSLAGSVLAIGLLNVTDSDSGPLTYVLIHGVVTGLIAGMWPPEDTSKAPAPTR